MIKSFDIFRSIVDREYYITCGYARNCLFLLLKALGIKQGDEIILPAYTCYSIVKTIDLIGAKPVFIDCEANGINMSSALIQKKVTHKSKAIYVIHAYGISADILKICDIAKTNGIYVIEDITHSYYVEFEGKRLGTFGDFTICSLTKLFINYQGAILATNNHNIYMKMLNIKINYGHKKNIFKYIPLYVVRLLSSWFERDSSLATLVLFRIVYLIMKTKKDVLDTSSKLDFNFFYMSKLSMFLTQIGLKRNVKKIAIDSYNKFKQSEKICMPLIPKEQTKGVPMHIGGFVRNYTKANIAFSLSTWSNIHKLGLYPNADEAYSYFRIFSKTYINMQHILKTKQ